MFSIGDFARLGGVSVRALRHYEEVGLLVPARVEAATGYRHYGATQLARLHRIVALKDLGLSLAQIGPLLDDLSSEQLAGMLRLKRAELADRLVEDHQRLARVENRLRHIQGEGQVPTDVVIKNVPALRVAGVRCDAPGLNFDNLIPTAREAFGLLQGGLKAAGVRALGPFFLFYEENPDGTLVPTVAVEIGDQELSTPDPITEVTLPPVEVASTVHHGVGGHDAIGPLYGQLASWAESHGYAIKGPGRDIIIQAPAEDGGSVVTELQLPVQRQV